MANGFGNVGFNILGSLINGMGGASGILNMLSKVDINQVMTAMSMMSKLREMKNNMGGFNGTNGANGVNSNNVPNNGGQNNMLGNILQSFIGGRSAQNAGNGIPQGNPGGQFQSIFSNMMGRPQVNPGTTNLFGGIPTSQPLNFSNPIFTASPLNQMSSFLSEFNYSPWSMGNMMGPFGL